MLYKESHAIFLHGFFNCISSKKKRTWKTLRKNNKAIMGDYKQEMQFRFTKSLFLLITVIQFIIVTLCIGIGPGAYSRAIQTSILTAFFIITSLLLFRYNKLDWFMNMVMTFLLLQTSLTAIVVHIEGSFNYNYIFYGAVGYFYNYLDNKQSFRVFYVIVLGWIKV